MRAIVLLLAAVLCLGSVHAQVPRKINYQGYLTDTSGAPRNGTVSMTFKLYSVLAGGSQLWAETQPSVSIANGIFNVSLGSVTALTLAFNQPYYLGVTVASDAEMTPRQALNASPYALMAANVSSPTYANWTPIGETVFPRSTTGNAVRYLWLAKVQGTTMALKICFVDQGGLGVPAPTCVGSIALPEPGASGQWTPAYVDTSHPLVATGTYPIGVAWFTSGGVNVVTCTGQGGGSIFPFECSPIVAIGN